jgi:hypothetical protein
MWIAWRVGRASSDAPYLAGLRITFAVLREVHAECVKISRLGAGSQNPNRRFIGVSSIFHLARSQLKKIQKPVDSFSDSRKFARLSPEQTTTTL